MESIEDGFSSRRALVYGIGGGGDVVGALPTARLLELHGVDVILGGIAWEREPHDSGVGPRGLDEVRGMELVNDSVALAGAETRTEDGLVFTESLVADHLDRDVALIDISGGVEAVTHGVEEACGELGVDLVVGVDSGGDVLARGDEPGVRSPIADGFGLQTLDSLETDSALAVFGYGSDGELSREELDRGVERAARRGGLLGAWGLSSRVAGEMMELIEAVGRTEASRLPVEAAGGRLGEAVIRGGNRSVYLTPSSTVTYYFTPGSVRESSLVAGLVEGAGSVHEAHQALSGEGIVTELDVERGDVEGGER